MKKHVLRILIPDKTSEQDRTLLNIAIFPIRSMEAIVLVKGNRWLINVRNI